jgi:hypothetical protein
MPIYAGVDPGQTGAMLALDQDGNIVFNGLLHSQVDTSTEQAIDFLRMLQFGSAMVYLERQQPFTQQGVTSTFAIGEEYGFWRGTLTALRIPHLLIQPKDWQGLIPGVLIRSGKKRGSGAGAPTKAEQQKAKAERKRRIWEYVHGRWPTALLTNSVKSKARHYGRSDALGIALYCWWVESGRIPKVK